MVDRVGRGPAMFKQCDVTRALKAMLAPGADGRVEIEPSGKLVVVMGRQPEAEINGGGPNEWDSIH